jgi:hypothetical protein
MMRVLVVHEDGDREDRVAELFADVEICVKLGTMRHQGVRVMLCRDDEVAI